MSKTVVVSGGPGGGKSTACDLIRREMGRQVAFVPEAATMLFSGGFPRYPEEECQMRQQKAIYHVQVNLEETQMLHFPGRVLLCDRGTLDGAAYWQKGLESWCEELETTFEAELDRYDAVIFFQSAAQSKLAINGTMLEGGNPVRLEDEEEARSLDDKLFQIWSKHPRFYLVKSQESFFKKISQAVEIFAKVLQDLESQTPLPPKRS